MLDYKLPIPHSPTHEILDGSKLNRFMECPRAFFYEYMLAWRSERPNNHLVFGSAWHEAMEHLLLNGYSSKSVAAAYEKFLERYRQELPDPDMDDMFWPKTPERAFLCLIEYAKQYHRDEQHYKPLYTEIAFRIQMDETRFLHGRMDSIIERTSDGLISSLEHKTGSSLNRWGEQFHMGMQGSLYFHVLACLYGFENVKHIIFNGSIFKKVKGTRGGSLFDFHREKVFKEKHAMQAWHFNTLYWMDQIENEYRLLSESSENDDVLLAFPMNTTNCSKWFGCQYKNFCMAWKNPLQKCHQCPMGMIVDHWNPMEEESKVTMEVGTDNKTEITKHETT